MDYWKTLTSTRPSAIREEVLAWGWSNQQCEESQLAPYSDDHQYQLHGIPVKGFIERLWLEPADPSILLTLQLVTDKVTKKWERWAVVVEYAKWENRFYDRSHRTRMRKREEYYDREWTQEEINKIDLRPTPVWHLVVDSTTSLRLMLRRGFIDRKARPSITS